jgi:ABC-type branched-subunit amino acid transport system ATPase component
MTEILKISELKGGYIPNVNILQGIDLELHQGEAVGIIGLNGSGKSTLGKSIMNMIPHREGEIIFNGESITYLSTSELARRGIAIMQQGGQVFRELSVWDNLQLSIGNRKNKACISELKSIIPIWGMPEKEQKARMADKLSGGQRHQLALAMALVGEPKLLILDEPSAGLSPKAVGEMYEILEVVRRKMKVAIVLIEQNINKAIGFCDYCLLLKQGVIEYKFDNAGIKEVENSMFNK